SHKSQRGAKEESHDQVSFRWLYTTIVGSAVRAATRSYVVRRADPTHLYPQNSPLTRHFLPENQQSNGERVSRLPDYRTRSAEPRFIATAAFPRLRPAAGGVLGENRGLAPSGY